MRVGRAQVGCACIVRPSGVRSAIAQMHSGRGHYPLSCGRRGEVAEWSIAAVLKTVDPRGSGGSNPSLSAILIVKTTSWAANPENSKPRYGALNPSFGQRVSRLVGSRPVTRSEVAKSSTLLLCRSSSGQSGPHTDAVLLPYTLHGPRSAWRMWRPRVIQLELAEQERRRTACTRWCR